MSLSAVKAPATLATPATATAYVSASKTRYKVVRFATAFFGTLSFFLASAYLTLGRAYIALSASLFCFSFVMAKLFQREKNYYSASGIKPIQEKAQTQSLEEAIVEHGLKRVLAHNILSEQELETKLQSHLVGMAPRQIIQTYKEFQKQANIVSKNNEHLAPIFKESILSQFRNIPLKTLFSEGHMSQFVESGLATEELKRAYKEYTEISKHHVENYTQLQIECATQFFDDVVQTFVTVIQATSALTEEELIFVNETLEGFQMILGQSEPFNIDNMHELNEEELKKSYYEGQLNFIVRLNSIKQSYSVPGNDRISQLHNDIFRDLSQVQMTYFSEARNMHRTHKERLESIFKTIQL